LTWPFVWLRQASRPVQGLVISDVRRRLDTLPISRVHGSL